jgi:hypothetical protein
VSARAQRGLITLGIDFSGSPAQWRMRDGASAVWIARVSGKRSPRLLDLRRVQDLPGDGPPFFRLVALLRAGAFDAAGIDAPLAPPQGWFAGSRAEFLDAVRALPREGRPFPTGAQLVALLAPDLAPRGRHVHRATEQVWRRRGINVRSVLWNGPRGGAPFAAAAFTLIAESNTAVWPWARRGPVLAETFPAAQLRSWGLPWFGYNGGDAAARKTRSQIVTAIVARRLILAPAHRRLLAASADALDSVLCALAARAILTDALASAPEVVSAQEGWIVVHR